MREANNYDEEKGPRPARMKRSLFGSRARLSNEVGVTYPDGVYCVGKNLALRAFVFGLPFAHTRCPA